MSRPDSEMSRTVSAPRRAASIRTSAIPSSPDSSASPSDAQAETTPELVVIRTGPASGKEDSVLASAR
jgi:hypothetical protein